MPSTALERRQRTKANQATGARPGGSEPPQKFSTAPVAARGTAIGVIDASKFYELEFTMDVKSFDTSLGYTSILHIGNTNGERWPGIWFKQDEVKFVVVATGVGQANLDFNPQPKPYKIRPPMLTPTQNVQNQTSNV